MLKTGLQSKSAKQRERVSATSCLCNSESSRPPSAKQAQCSCGRSARPVNYQRTHNPRCNSGAPQQSASVFPPLQIFVLSGSSPASSLHDLARLCQPVAHLLPGAIPPAATAPPKLRAQPALASNDLRHSRRPPPAAPPSPDTAPARSATSQPPKKSKSSKRHVRAYNLQLAHERAILFLGFRV